MVISYKWLQRYISLEGLSIEQISEKLTLSGLEVEKITDNRVKYNGFVVGLVKEKVKHPNADKLSWCKVFDGKEELSIVCGAPNVEAGQHVVLATVGTAIPGKGFEIKKSKIRGIESAGMLCSESELELSNNHDGIMVLENSPEPGTPVSEVLGLNDVIFEIGITPNRPDALSHIGVARDLSALFKRPLKLPELQVKESDEAIEALASVEIHNPESCPRYSAMVVKNVTIKESPAWLKDCLKAIGLRPINNVVDVTNFVLHEMGQPLHAFDLDKLSGRKIIVADAGSMETFTTLDSVERKLNPDILMINDASGPVAVAGIMGGENSEVTSSTKNILIESAYFNPQVVRKGAKFLQMSTDASYRFERGTDYSQTAYAAARAAVLIAECAGGTIAKGTIDIYPAPVEAKAVTLRFERISKILGFSIPASTAVEILISLGFRLKEQNSENITVYIPSFRPDIEREIDLIEEVVRIYGYQNIPDEFVVKYPVQTRIDETDKEEDIRNILTSLGYYEAISLPMISHEESAAFGIPVKLKNPLIAEMEYLRTSLIPGMLQNVKRNINAGAKDIRLFEMGNVMSLSKEGEISWENLIEEQHGMFLLTGEAESKEWYNKQRNYDLFDIKGDAAALLQKFSVDSFPIHSYYSNENNIFGSILEVRGETGPVLWGGSIKKDVLKKYDIEQPVYCVEFDLNKLAALKSGRKEFKLLPKFPKVYRDFAFVMDSAVTYNQVAAIIEKQKPAILESYKLFDVYEHESLGSGKKSIAVALVFYDEQGTLTDEKVDKEFTGLIQKISKTLNAQLRGTA